MADRTLTVKILGDEDDLIRAFRSSTRASQRFTASFGTFLKGAVIFEGVRAGMDALGNAVRSGTNEFSQMAQVTAQTQAVLKSTGGIANVTADEVERLATRLSRLSGTDDEAIASSENLLLTFKNVRNELGRGNQIFDRATLAALDLSKAAGGAFGSLDATAKQLGKALNDPVRGLTALTRAGVTFSDEQKKLIKNLVDTGRVLDAQKIILKEVESQVGGSAKAFGETLPGQLSKIREAFRNAFGNLIAIVAQPLAKALGAFADFIPKIEDGVSRISNAVGPALNRLVESFTSKLPQLQRIATSILDPLQEHVFPILREFSAIAQRVWANIVEVFDSNSGNIRQILDNLGTVLSNVWTVARPTIVFLFEKVLPTALRIVIPIIARLTDVTRILSEIFVRSVRVIVTVLDKFLGAMASLADAASHLPFIGDKFKGVSDKINGAREGLREFGKDLDALDGRRVEVDVVVVHGSEGRAPGKKPPKDKDESDAVDEDTKSKQRTETSARKNETQTKKTTTATKSATTAAERQRKVFDDFIGALGIRQDAAADTKRLTDDLRVNRAVERALEAQIKVEGRTNELVQRLQDVRQERVQLLTQQKTSRQFEKLGLTGEGQQRTPSVAALQNRLGNIQEQVKGTPLDTKKTRTQLQRIAKVLSGDFGKVGKDVRQAILQMFNDISGGFDEGAKKSGPLTKTSSLNSKKVLAGLGLSPEEIRALRGRLSNFNSAGVGFAGASGSRTTGSFSSPMVVESHVTVNLDKQKVGSAVTREQQKTKRRNPQQKRGPNRR